MRSCVAHVGEQKGGGGGGEGDGGEGLVGQAAICVATPANSMLRPESTLLTVKVSCAQRRRGEGERWCPSSARHRGCT